jgi:hypothetical protein
MYEYPEILKKNLIVFELEEHKFAIKRTNLIICELRGDTFSSDNARE